MDLLLLGLNNLLETDSEDSLQDEEASEATRRLSTNTLNYFEHVSGERVRCGICLTTMPNLDKLLERHMKEKHPKQFAGQTEEVSEVYLKDEDDDQEDMYTEVVYLEEEPNNAEENRTKEKKRRVLEAKAVRRTENPIRLHAVTPKKRPQKRESTSSDEYLVKKPKTTIQSNTKNEDDNEIDSFGKYITCLLKKLPRSVCRKLQMNIVNLIMNANIEEEQNKNVETVPITIQRLPVQTIQSTNYVVVEEKDVVSQNVTVTSAPQINNVETVTVNTSDDQASTALSFETCAPEQEGLQSGAD